jgi:hypothetical protein
MWTASVWSQPWHCIGFLLMRQGQGAPQQQPMMREPAISKAAGVAGAGFVSAACQNPTWTIMALCWRSCDYLVEELKRGHL